MKWSEILKLSDTELVVVNADKRISLQKTASNKFIRRWRKEQVIKVQWGCVETNYSNR
jgi:hypothetical protein